MILSLYNIGVTFHHDIPLQISLTPELTLLHARANDCDEDRTSDGEKTILKVSLFGFVHRSFLG